MSDAVSRWIGDNIKWIIAVTAIVLSNYFFLANKIDQKADKSEIKMIIKDELRYTFPNEDGKVLQSQYNEILRRLDAIEKKLDTK